MNKINNFMYMIAAVFVSNLVYFFLAILLRMHGQ